VLLDDPWKGQEIATVNVPAEAKGVLDCVADVPAVEGLSGKHAIYLVAEGPEVQQPQQPQRGQFGGRGPQQPQRPQGLFDLHGIGFGKAGNACVAPKVPQVTITADGQKLTIPTTPVRFNAQNGYAEQNRYKVYGKLGKGSKLEAKADVNGVKFEISPIVEGRATIKATYDGQTKIFLIN
jgi:hypothetical protein